MDGDLSRLPSHERRRLLALESDDVEELARRRLAGEPLQYLEGSAPFVDFEVTVDERVLVPRPETEGLYELVADLAPPPGVVVDLGTGSGVLALALARRYPRAEVHACDLSSGALDVARVNADRLGVLVHFHLGDLFSALPASLRGHVDLVVSNPPYVAEEDWDSLPPDVRNEPRLALVAGPGGTELLERIADEARVWLAPSALVACEIGESQAAAVTESFRPLGEVSAFDDLAGRSRYVLVRRRS